MWPKSHRVSFDTTGTVEAKNEILIVPQVSGRVIVVNEAFFAGGSFEKEAVLFEIEPSDFVLDVERREADVARAITALELEQAEAEASIAEWRQINNDKEPPALVARAPQLSEAKANLKSARAQLEIAKLNLQRTKFTLPFNGRVLESDIAVGQFITAGQAYGKLFDHAALEVKASLDRQQLEWLLETKQPDIRFVTTHLGETLNHQGVFLRGASALDNNTRFAEVRFGFKDVVKAIIPGVFVDIEVYGPEMPNVMLLASSSRQSQNSFWTVDNDALVKWVPDIIYSDNDYIAVKGKSSPITVVTSRVAGGMEGMRIQTAQQEDPGGRNGK